MFMGVLELLAFIFYGMEILFVVFEAFRADIQGIIGIFANPHFLKSAIYYLESSVTSAPMAEKW